MKNFANMTVLLVDDNRHMLRTISSILGGFGVREVKECIDAADAFSAMAENAIDIVITDWRMEPLDGLDLVRLLRTAKDSPNPYVPIIMLTGFTEKAHVIESRDAGVTEFLAKPVTPEALYQRLRQVIDHPRPFVKTKSYFGPDRRRRNDGPPDGVERRAAAPKSAGLTQDEVEKLFLD